MARVKFQQLEETYNPFEINVDYDSLKSNLNSIDNRDIRYKFKNTQDPINLAFESFNNMPLKTLAKDFVKESFNDFVSFISEFCK